MSSQFTIAAKMFPAWMRPVGLGANLPIIWFESGM
jgi:hypothetical protein